MREAHIGEISWSATILGVADILRRSTNEREEYTQHTIKQEAIHKILEKAQIFLQRLYCKHQHIG